MLEGLAGRLGLRCVATGNIHAHARLPRPPPGRVRRPAPQPHARVERAPPASQRSSRPVLACGDGRPLPRAPGRGRRDRRRRRPARLRPDLGSRLPVPRRRGRDGRAATLRALPGPPARSLRRRRPGRGQRTSGRRAAGDRGARARGILPPPPRHARARPGGRGRGPRPGYRPGPAAARTRSRVVGLVDRLLPDRPLPHRPDLERPFDGPLPQPRAELGSRHRPRLPPRHPRGPDPPGPRPLRARPGGPRRDLPELPVESCDPRARQGARSPAGRDRAGGPRGRWLLPAGRAGHRDGARAQPRPQRDGGPGSNPSPARPTASPATSPSIRGAW